MGSVCLHVISKLYPSIFTSGFVLVGALVSAIILASDSKIVSFPLPPDISCIDPLFMAMSLPVPRSNTPLVELKNIKVIYPFKLSVDEFERLSCIDVFCNDEEWWNLMKKH